MTVQLTVFHTYLTAVENLRMYPYMDLLVAIHLEFLFFPLKLNFIEEEFYMILVI